MCTSGGCNDCETGGGGGGAAGGCTCKDSGSWSVGGTYSGSIMGLPDASSVELAG